MPKIQEIKMAEQKRDLPFLTFAWVKKAAFSFVLAGISSGILSGCSSFSGSSGGDEYDDRGRQRIPILTSAGSLEADATMEDRKVVIPAPYRNLNWAQAGGNASHNAQHLSLGETVSLAWKAKVGRADRNYERVIASPVVAGGVIYSVDSAGVVYATDFKTGKSLWSKRYDDKITEQSNIAYGGGVAYSKGRIFVTSGYGFIVAANAKNGDEIWRYKSVTPFRGAPTVLEDRVIAVTNDNLITAVTRDTGEFIWDYIAIAENAGMLGAASPASDGTAVVAALSSGELITLLSSTGQLVWQDSLSSNRRLTPLSTLTDIDGNPVIAGGRAYAVSHAGRMVSIDMRTGERSWEADVAGTKTPWIAGNYLFVTTIDAQISCISAVDGRVRWVNQLQRFTDQKKRRGLITWNGPVLAGDRLIVTSSHGYIASISPYDGRVISVVKMPSGSTVDPVVVDNTILVFTKEAELLAYR